MNPLGLQSSDKYLKEMRLREAERRSGKKVSSKKKKKHKRGKKGQPVDSSEEDDIPVQHSVSSAFDLPEVHKNSDTFGTLIFDTFFFARHVRLDLWLRVGGK